MVAQALQVVWLKVAFKQDWLLSWPQLNLVCSKLLVLCLLLVLHQKP